MYNRIYEYDLKKGDLKMLSDFKMNGPKFDEKKYEIAF